MIVPRRIARVVLYLAVLALLTLVSVLTAHRRRYINLDRYIPASLMPSYFQPPADSYVVDIQVVTCGLMALKAHCGMPAASAGAYGDLGLDGGWVKVDKELLLGKHWRPKHLYVKTIRPERYEAAGGPLVVDMAFSGPLDCQIRGNKKCIPKAVLADLNDEHVFDQEDLEWLREVNKDETLNMVTDKDKAVDKLNMLYEKAKAEAEKAGLEPQDTKQESSEGDEEKGEEKEEEKKEKEEKEEDRAEKPKKRKSRRVGSLPNLHKRLVETSHTALKNYFRIPSDEDLERAGWAQTSKNVWLKHEKLAEHAITGIDVLFGEDAVDPRPNWKLLPSIIDASLASAPRPTIRRGPKLNYKASLLRQLQFRADHKFKILQVADLHFLTGVGKCRDPAPESTAKDCEADPRTLKFLNRVLDLEKPDFVVMTGDQVFGETAPDPETAFFKAVNPMIKRKIPYAVVMGNHDDESSLTREQMMDLAVSMPYSLAALGPTLVDGYGNYMLTVAPRGSGASATMYFLDSHSRLMNPKVKGYEWFKELQVNWLMSESALSPRGAINMAFFHIPIPEYLDRGQPTVGQFREAITAPRRPTGMRAALASAGVQVVSVGHDHANDFCLLNEYEKDGQKSHTWMCFGGGVGEGGYGGYGGYIRRLRVFELDLDKTVRTWKRAENDPDQVFDEQVVVQGGNVVTTV